MRIFVSSDGTWGDAKDLSFLDVTEEEMHLMQEMSDREVVSFARAHAPAPMEQGPFSVTGMFDDGLFELHQENTNHYETLDINSFVNDKRTLDNMVEVYRTSSSQSDETEGVWHLLQIARPDQTQKLSDDESEKAVSTSAS